MNAILHLLLAASCLFAYVGCSDDAIDASAQEGDTPALASAASTNAADEYHAIYEQLGNDFFADMLALDSIDAVSPELASSLERNEAAIERLLAASRMTTCDFRINLGEGPLASMPHLAEVRAMTKLLYADAIRLAKSGDKQGAAARMAAAIRLCRQVGETDVVIAKLLAFACIKPACALSKEMADKKLLAPDGKREILLELQAINSSDPFDAKGGLDGERQSLQLSNANSPALGDVYGEQWRSATQAERDAAIAEALEYLEKVQATWTRPGAFDEIKAMESRFSSPLTRRIFGVMSQYRKQADNCRTDLRTAMAALQK